MGGRRTEGFTLVEIMIVVTIIGMLSAISIPAMARARATAQRNACLSNLRTMNGAKEQWALENFKTGFDPVDVVAVGTYLKGGIPTCPAGGRYFFMRVDMNPTCSTPFHILQ